MVHIKRRLLALVVVAVWLLLGLLAYGRIGNAVVWLGLGLLAAIVLLDAHIRQVIRDTNKRTRPHTS